MIETAIQLIESGGDLPMQRMTGVMGQIMDGNCTEDAITRLLTALHRKGESITEIAGAAAAMRARMTPIHSSHTDLIDTCGTGGDGSKTFNISTAAALVAAAAGVHVAKHGNRAATSRSGSADVLTALGVNIEANTACVENCLETLGICFCFAPLLHSAMKHVAPVRKKIGTPTIFNILGPLANPASAPFQLLGVGHAELRPQMAETLQLLGIRRALVVHGADGLDEVTLNGATDVTDVTADRLLEFRWNPADFGLEPATRDSLLVSGPAESAAVIRAILAGHRGPARDIVVANAAAAIWTVGRSPSILLAVQQAEEALDTGAARDLLARLAELTVESA